MDLGKYRSKEKGRSQGDSRDFLKSSDLPKNGNLTVKIDDVREPARGSKAATYNDILIDVSFGKQKRTWGLREGFTLDAMIDKLGKNSDRWKGKKLSLTRGGDKGQYINLAR